MDSILNEIKTLFVTYGFDAAWIVVLTVALVNVLKKPVVRFAERTAERTGGDKSTVTRYVGLFPFAVSLLLTFVWVLGKSGFQFAALDFGAILSDGVLNGALAVATYELVKKQLEAYAAKRNAPSNVPVEDTQTAEDAKSERQSDATADLQDTVDCILAEVAGGLTERETRASQRDE